MKTISTCILLFSATLIQAQSAIYVLDSETDKPITGALVLIPEMNEQLLTDSAGMATLPATQARAIRVVVEAEGYSNLSTAIELSTPTLILKLSRAHLELNEVVVAAEHHNLQSENTMHVIALKTNTIATASSVSLAEKLQTIPGVQQVSTGPGIGKPVIRGLSGNRIAVYNQGIRMENQQWGDEHGLGLEEFGIESVEVIKGPASLIYGADALGGVLYFVDERFAKPSSIEARLRAQYFSNTTGLRNSAAFKISKRKLRFNLFGGNSTHTDYNGGNDVHVFNSRFNNQSLKSSLGFNTSSWNTVLTYSLLKEQFGLSEAEHEGEAEIHDEENRTPQLPYQQLATHVISSDNTFYLTNSKLKLTAGIVSNQRQEFDEHHHEVEEHHEEGGAALDMLLNTASANLRWYSAKSANGWQHVIGAQGMTQSNENSGEEILIPNAHTNDMGAFFTSSHSFGTNSLFQIGARYDSRKIATDEVLNDEGFVQLDSFEQSFSNASFSTGVQMQASDEVKLRANLASGFRAPNSFELLSNGEHHGTGRYEIGNRFLHSERSYQFDLSLDYHNDHFEFSLSPFTNYIINYIFISPSGLVIDELPVYNYHQANATLVGNEIGFHLHPHALHWLHIEANHAIVLAQDEKGNALPAIPSQKINTTLRADIAKSGKRISDVQWFIQALHSFGQHETASFELSTTDYSLLNSGVSFNLHFGKQFIELSGGVRNALDRNYTDHLSRNRYFGIPDMGRNFFFALQLPLNVELNNQP